MNLSDSILGKVGASIAKYGLRAGIQDAAARWGQGRLRVPLDVVGDYGWILNKESPATRQPPASGPFVINWLTTDVHEGSGGLLGLFRAIYHLEQWGHTNRVFMVGSTTNSAKRATDIAREIYFPIKAQVEVFQGQVPDSDALVATHWTTAYAVRALGNTAAKFYFVQDVEPLFFPAGSSCEFVKQTYRWGFQGITLGPWIANVLQSDFGMSCAPFGFSYDRDPYSPQGSRYFPDKRRRVLFYARPRTERRGFELGVLALSLVAQRLPDTEFVLVGFPPRAIRLPFPAVLPGVLSPADLAALYRSCSLALVLSYTNLSLLPLELMACNCPVVSNTGPNVEWLLTDENAQLADSNPEALADAMVGLLQDDGLRARKIAAGRALAESTNWISEIRTIESALYRGMGVRSPQSPYVSSF
jgi:glycosyltransferase involved in cell wall biosynthesis